MKEVATWHKPRARRSPESDPIDTANSIRLVASMKKKEAARLHGL